MARSKRPLPPATVHILLALLDGPAHGYGIKKAIETRTDGKARMRAATLYEALHRLDRGGLIEETGTPSEDQDATSRWRFYRLTDAGERALRSDLARMDAILCLARARGMVLHGESP